MKRVPVNTFDHDTLTFKSYYDELPLVNDRPKILLPISSVRRDPQLSKDKYYRNFVLEFLKAEHTHAGDSLASVLKNGSFVVRISDLKEKYPMATEFLYQFSKEHPQVLEKFKSELRRTASKNGGSPKLEPKKKVLTAQERIDILANIKTGNDDATSFHKISFDNLIHIFGHRLSSPDSEVKINDGRKRIDIVFNNDDKNGFFHKLNTLHHIQCPKILIECKNYGREIGNSEVDQLQTRFSNLRGKFGILLCRNINDKATMVQRCKDVLHDRQAYVIVLDDTDLNSLLQLKENGEETKIDDFMTQKFDELIM